MKNGPRNQGEYLKKGGAGMTTFFDIMIQSRKSSLVDLGLPVTMADVDTALKERFSEIFGPVVLDD